MAEGQKPLRVGGRDYVIVQAVDTRGFNWDLRLDNERGAEELDVLVPHAENGACCRFTWAGSVGRLSRSGQADAVLLAEGKLPDLRAKGKHDLSIRRRSSAIYVVVDGNLTLEAIDSSITSGVLAIWAGDGRLDITKARVQPVETIRFTDDFMRDEENPDLGPWSVVRGKYAFRSVRAKVKETGEERVRKGARLPEAQRSANPFTFEATAGEEFLAVTGYHFWDDYELSVAAKTEGGACGLVFHYRSPDDCFLFQWEPVSYRRHAARAQLLKVTPKGREVLAEREVLGRIEQWYNLAVRLDGKRVRASIDRVPIFDVFDDRATGGMAGIFASASHAVFFDDVSVCSSGGLDLDREALLSRYGRAVTGEWKAKERSSDSRGFPATAAILHSETPKPSIYGVGDANAQKYVLETECQVDDKDSTPGMVFGLRGAGDYWLVQAKSQADGSLYELVQVTKGQAQSVSSVSGPSLIGRWTHWGLDLSELPLMKVYADDRLVLLADVPHDVSGQAGLYSAGNSRSSFRAISIRTQPKRDWEQIEDNAIFANDPYMQGWASPRWAWVPLVLETTPPPAYSNTTKPRIEMEYPVLVEEEKQPEQPVVEETKRREYVHKGDFFGSFAIRVPVSDGLMLSFGDEDPTREKGYTVEIASLAKKQSEEAKAATPTESHKVINPTGLVDEEEPDAVEDKIKEDKESSGGKVIVATKETAQGEGAFAVRLLRNGEPVKDVRITLSDVGNALVTVNRDGHYVWVSQGSTELFEHRDDKPLDGRRVRLITYKKNDLVWVDVKRDHVKDYLFKTAPADWMKVGQWEVTNRFACDPRWSHLNGESHSAAVLWHKDRFIGDVTLEFYAGMRMRQGEMKTAERLYYPRVGDMNATVCATGEEASSGYSFILGAWDPLWSETWTRILRKNQSVADTDVQLLPRTRIAGSSARVVRVGWDPGGRPIHGAWYYVKIRKTGNQVKYYFDNHLALTFQDDDPLAGDRLGIWTYNNSMMVARARISYNRVEPCADILDIKPQHRLADRRSADLANVHLRSSTHPGVCFDFDSHFQGWEAPNADESAHLSLDTENKASGAASLCLTKALSGGDFGVRAPVAGIDLLKVEELAFDYRIPPEARINLYFSIKDDPHHCERYFVYLNGETRSTHLAKLLEGAPAVIADGKWHRFSMNLGAAFAALYPSQDELRVKELLFGNFHEGYLNVGFGGNAAGTTYHLDNFTMTVRGPAQVKLDWTMDGDSAPEAYAVSLSRKSENKPDSRNVLSGSSTGTELGAKEEGLWYAHVAAQIDGKTWTPTARLPIFVESPAPRIVAVEPKDGAAWGGEPIRLTVAEGSNVSTSHASLELNGKPVPPEKGALAFSRLEKVVKLDLNASGITAKQGEKVRFALQLPGREAGPTRYEWTHVFDTARDKTPPARVRLLGQPARFDFETPESSFEFYSEDAVATLDRTTAARGTGSLRLFNMYAGSTFAVPFPIPAFHSGQFAILSFDYKVAPLVSSNFVLQVEGTETTLEFTDSSSGDKTLGEVPGIVADDQWHHAEVNLLKLLSSSSAAARCTDEELTVTAFTMEDQGYLGNAPRASILLDNLELVPSVSSARGFALKWNSRDVGSIRGYGYSWTQDEPGVPEEKVLLETAEGTFQNVPEGDVFFNIRCVDSAGNWSEPAHYRFRIDNTAPKLSEPRPGPEEKTAWRFVRLKVEEAGSGIDVKTMKLRVGDESYSFDPNCTRYDATTGLLEWDWAIARGGRAEPSGETQTLSGRIEGLQDFAGNTAEPIVWTWTVVTEADELPPLAPVVKSLSHSLFAFKTFAKGREGCVPYGGTARVARVSGAKTSDYYLQVTQLHSNGSYGAIIVDQPFDVRKHPILSFEYRFRRNAKVYLYAKVKDRWHQFTEGPDIMADNEWHLTWCDLERLFDLYVGKDQGSTIEALAVTDYYYYELTTYLEEAQCFFLDGIGLVGRDGKAKPVFEVGTIDETGVSGYSYVFDDKYDKVADVKDMAKNLTQAAGDTGGETAEDMTQPKVDFQFDRYTKTVPKEISRGLFKRLELDGVPRTGMLFLHIRSQDGAGNWGETTHYPYFVPAGTKTGAGDDGGSAERDLMEDLGT
jgi:hypothetical protein